MKSVLQDLYMYSQLLPPTAHTHTHTDTITPTQTHVVVRSSGDTLISSRRGATEGRSIENSSMCLK